MTESTATEREENVLIESGHCSAVVLHQYGGKIASLRFRGQELLQSPLAPIEPRTPSMPFEAADASGWDECLPSVAACTVNTPAGQAHIPDHGDLWRVPWTVTERDSQSITLNASCFSLPLQLVRKLSIAETENGAQLSLDYKLTNTGGKSVPWSWAAHPLFAASLGDRIVLPDSIHTLRLEASRDNRLGTMGDEKQWPVAEQADGSDTDLSWVAAPDSGIADKLFAGPMNSNAGWCALERPSAGLRIRVSFDPNATPYIGLWICYGGWPARPGRKQVCVALEPSTAPLDSLAITGPWSRTLAPGESAGWPMHVHLETL